MSEEIIYREIPQSEIIINPVEKAARLKTKVGYTDEIIERCEKLLRETAVCRFSAVREKLCFMATAGWISASVISRAMIYIKIFSDAVKYSSLQ